MPDQIAPFLIIGQPRSGTTYLQTLLNAHLEIHCRGELFDPWQIDDDGEKTRGLDAVIARDAAPEAFLDARLSGADRALPAGITRLGAKILFQHHPRLFSAYIPQRPQIRLIHVRRENKLAQFASLQQVARTNRWTGTEPGAPAPRIGAGPLWAASECNRLENEDFLLAQWLSGCANPLLSVTYRGLFAPDFAARVQAFLGVAPQAELRSTLVKQGQDRIIERFENPDDIARYFASTGRGDWLEPELGPAHA